MVNWLKSGAFLFKPDTGAVVDEIELQWSDCSVNTKVGDIPGCVQYLLEWNTKENFGIQDNQTGTKKQLGSIVPTKKTL